MKRIHACLFFLSSLTVSSVFTAETESNSPPLPDPLSFEAALELVEYSHPDIELGKQAVDLAKQNLNSVDSETDLDVRAKLEAGYVEPVDRVREFGREDHKAKIVAHKTIYDFGRTGNKTLAAKNTVNIAELQLKKIAQLRRLDIMQAFFDVILADLQYNFDNEAMAIYFIDYDRTRERFELGQLSEIDVLQKQSEYMEVRRDRYRSEAQQRAKRVAMSDVLNRPGQIISRFLPPKLDYHKHTLIELEKLQASAIENNLELIILKKKRKRANALKNSLRANRNPSLFGQAEAGVYSREFGSNDIWRIGLGIEIPLYQGTRVDSQLAMQSLRAEQIDLQIYQKELDIKQNVLSLWLAIDVLQKQKESTVVELDYREVYLDRARSLYEMEVKTDLGDSMVALTQAARYQAETEFEIAMNWEKLRYITQMTLEDMRQ